MIIFKSLLPKESFEKEIILSSRDFEKKVNDTNKINFKTFLNCLALAGLNVKYDIYSNSIQKIIFLFERMHQSKGVKESMIKLAQIK